MSASLVVKPKCARLERDLESFGTMDPYVKIVTGSQTEKTCVHTDGGKYPQWDDVFTLTITDEDLIRVQVWNNNNVNADDMIGEGVMVIATIKDMEDGTWKDWLRIDHEGKQAGKVEMEFQYIQESEEADVEIIEQQPPAQEAQIDPLVPPGDYTQPPMPLYPDQVNNVHYPPPPPAPPVQQPNYQAPPQPLTAFLHTNGNNQCVDCGKAEVNFVSLNNGVFICQACSTTHSGLGSALSDIYPIDMLFSPAHVALIQHGGNIPFNNFMAEFQFPSSFPAQHRCATRAGEFYRNQLSSAVQGYEILVGKPNPADGRQMATNQTLPAPPVPKKQGFFQKGKGLFNKMTNKMDDVVNKGQDYINNKIQSNPKLKKLEENMEAGFNKVGAKVDKFGAKVENAVSRAMGNSEERKS